MRNHSQYQPLPQTAEETDSTSIQAPSAPSSPTSPTVHFRDSSISEDHASARLSRSLTLPPPRTAAAALADINSSRRKGPRIDLTKVDQAFRRWKETIAQKVRRKKRNLEADGSKKEIAFSVFTPVGDINAPAYNFDVKTLDHKPAMTAEDFEAMATEVRTAILDDIHPKMIAKGSSGSYFARAKDGNRVKIVGVFKPKDEEPYGKLNPKTTKWLHRNLFWWVGFGRSCLIPNLSYISEASASLLDARLRLYIVPRTELVSFSSPAFYYDWIDRMEAKKGKILPEKIGSLQCFQHGYQDASIFLREHPWPGRAISDTFDDATHRTGGASKKCLSAIGILCGRTGDFDDDDDYDERLIQGQYDGSSYSRGDSHDHERFVWTPALQQNFREELEKLIILDYLMRNTDRGLDNFMIKYCPGTHEKTVVDVAPSRSAIPTISQGSGSNQVPGSHSASASTSSLFQSPARSTQSPSYTRTPHVHIAAIDNSLSFPHQHPKGWRSYTYGWLYLPVSLIGRPFSESTRKHFLPLLSSPAWWSETIYQLRKVMEVDPDFHPKMFARQMAVMKGQGWNIVQCLQHSDEGPLELTRRVKVLVWDDEIEVAEDASQEELLDEIAEYRAKHVPDVEGVLFPGQNVFSPKRPARQPRHQRSRSLGGSAAFPPRQLRRTSTSTERPVPFAGKFTEGVFPGASGVAVLEHLERLDVVESKLKKLGRGDTPIQEESDEESLDVDQTTTTQDEPPEPPEAEVSRLSLSLTFSPREMSDSLVLSASPTSTVTPSNPFVDGSRTSSGDAEGSRGRGRDRARGEPKMRVVIAERLETVNSKPFFNEW